MKHFSEQMAKSIMQRVVLNLIAVLQIFKNAVVCMLQLTYLHLNVLLTLLD